MRSGGFPFCPGRGQSKQTVSVFFSLRLQLTALVSKSGGLCLDSGLDCLCAEGKTTCKLSVSSHFATCKVAEWIAGVSWILSVQFGVDRKMKKFKCDSNPQDIIQKVTRSNIQEHSQQVQWSFRSKWDCWHPAGWPHWCLICSPHRPLAKIDSLKQ